MTLYPGRNGELINVRNGLSAYVLLLIAIRKSMQFAFQKYIVLYQALLNSESQILDWRCLFNSEELCVFLRNIILFILHRVSSINSKAFSI